MEKDKLNNNLFSLNPLPSWIYDYETLEILDVNIVAIDHYGYSREQFLSLTLKDLRPPKEVPTLISAHADIKNREGNIYFGIFTHQKKNGTLIQMEINGHKVDFNDRQCILVVCQDVTEKEYQVQQLKDSEEKLKTISSMSQIGYWKLEMDGNTLSWTDEVYTIWGQNQESFELNYENLVQTIHPADREAFEEEQRASFSGVKEHDFIHRIVLPDNSIRWVHELGRLVRDKNGKPLSFEGTVQNITTQKKEEQRLRLLESVITHTNDAIVITEAEPQNEPGPRILYVNEAFTNMTGYTSEEVFGKSPRILQGPNTERKELDRLSSAMRNWKPCEVTVVNYKKNGEEFWINFSVSPVADEKGWFTHWISIERDVTEQKQKELEKELLGKISLNFSFENDLLSASTALCQTISNYGRFDFVELWLPTIENTHIQLFSKKSSSPNADTFYEWSKDIKSFAKGEGLPGTIWNKKTTLLWKDISKKDDFVRKEAAQKAAIESAMGIPLIFHEKIVGVLVVGTQGELHHLEKYQVLFEHLRQFIGSEINRKKLENDLQHLYDAIPDIICITDLQGRFLEINTAGCDLIGHSEEDILYNTFEKFVHPDDKDSSHNDLDKLNKGGKTFGFENRYINKSGDIIWLSWTCNSNLQEGLIYATARNITKEKRLRELNRQVSKLAKIGSWEVNFANNEIIFSEMVHELHETDPKTFTPDLEGSIDFYREDFKELVRQNVEKCVASGIPFDFEAVLVTAKKNERWVRAIGNAEIIDGQCLRLYGSFQDIHERKEAESRLKDLSDNIPGVVFQYLLYPDGTDALRYVSKASEKIWGYSPKEVSENIDLVWDQIKAGGDFEAVKQSIIDSVENKSQWSIKYRTVSPDGEKHIHQGLGTPEFLADGTVLYNSMVLDVTQEAKNEELLELATDLARIGSWEIDLVGNKLIWSDMVYVLHETDPNSFEPDLETGINFYREDFIEMVTEEVAKCIEKGIPFDFEAVIITAHKNERWIRAIGQAEMIDGKCQRVYGSFQDVNERKKSEIKLAESENRIRTILEAEPECIKLLGPGNEVLMMNPAGLAMIEADIEEQILGKSVLGIVLPEHRSAFSELTKNVFEGESGKLVFEIKGLNGTHRWMETHAVPLKNEQGKIISLLGITRDISDRKKAEEELQKAYEEKNNILESIGDAFFAVDKNWIVTYWNKEAETVLGKKREEIVGENLWEKYADAIDSDFYRQYHQAKETGEAVNFEEHYPTLNKWFEVAAYPSEEGLSVYFKDVTLRKEADIRLLQANERFEKVTEATNDAIWDWNIKENTLYWGGGFKKRFGYEVDKITPTLESWTNHIHPDDRNWVVQSIHEAIEKPGQTNWIAKYSYEKSDGTFAKVIDRGIVIRNVDGKPIRMVGAMTDITEQKNHEEQLVALNESLQIYAKDLERSNEELESFAFITSHDLQEPLRMITSFMDQLKRKYGDQLDEKALQYIHFATDGAKRMKQIILDLLEYSRAGRPTDSMEEVDVNEIVSEFKQLRRKVISEKAVSISTFELPTIYSYKAAVTQILHSLLDNAIKYSKDGIAPHIEIAASKNNDEWQFSIKDNGIGIKSEFHDQIFIIFQRLHNQGKYDGTGIGLSIAKKHIEFLGGKIWLESIPDNGTTFYFTIAKQNTNK